MEPATGPPEVVPQHEHTIDRRDFELYSPKGILAAITGLEPERGSWRAPSFEKPTSEQETRDLWRRLV